jgi:hypothetical protein
MTYIAQLKERVEASEAERDYYKSLVDAFFDGKTGASPSLAHMILAQWGRRRLAEKRAQPALLQSQAS